MKLKMVSFACDLVSSYLSFCSVLLDRFFFMIFFPFCLRGSFSVCFPVKFCEDACGFWVSDRVIFRFPFRGFSQILELEFQNAAFLLAMLIFFFKKGHLWWNFCGYHSGLNFFLFIIILGFYFWFSAELMWKLWSLCWGESERMDLWSIFGYLMRGWF